MMDLSAIAAKKQPVITHIAIAKDICVRPDELLSLIRLHKSALETFGEISFKMCALESGIRRKEFQLNESQAALLILLMGNKPKVIDIKKHLVKQLSYAVHKVDLLGGLCKFQVRVIS